MSSTTGPLPPLGTAAHLPPGGLIAIAWCSVALAGAFVIARTLIRIVKAERLGYDDYWIYLAYLILCINAILQTAQTPYVYHLIRVRAGLEPAGEGFLKDGNTYLRYEFAIIGLFWSVLWSVKASFLAFYWKLFDGLPKYKKWWLMVAVFAFASYVGCWIASAMTCHPASLYFKFGQCYKPIDMKGSTISVAYSTTVDVLTDVMIISLPLNLLYTVRLARKQKIGLGAVFSIGIIIILVAIARAVQISRKAFADGVLLALWGIIESTVSVIVGCLPPFKSLIKGRGSFQRYKNPNYDKNLPSGIRLDAIRLGSAENSDSAKAEPKVMSRPIDGNENWSYGRHGDGHNVPHGAIGVRIDYEVTRHESEP